MAELGIHPVKIVDDDGDVVSVGSGRLAVETEQDDAFSAWETFPDFAAATGTAVSLEASLGEKLGLKEIVIQTDDANTSYIMVGSSSGTTVADATAASRQGIKLNGGETLVLALDNFGEIFVDAEVSGQLVSVAYFK